MPSAGSSIVRQASKLSHEYSADRSISAARGAISFSAKSRTVSRSMAMVSPCSKRI